MKTLLVLNAIAICAVVALPAPRVKRQNLFGWQLGSPSIFGAGDSWNLDRSNGELSRKSNLGVAGQNLGLTSALRLPGFGNGGRRKRRSPIGVSRGLNVGNFFGTNDDFDLDLANGQASRSRGVNAPFVGQIGARRTVNFPGLSSFGK